MSSSAEPIEIAKDTDDFVARQTAVAKQAFFKNVVAGGKLTTNYAAKTIKQSQRVFQDALLAWKSRDYASNDPTISVVRVEKQTGRNVRRMPHLACIHFKYRQRFVAIDVFPSLRFELRGMWQLFSLADAHSEASRLCLNFVESMFKGSTRSRFPLRVSGVLIKSFTVSHEGLAMARIPFNRAQIEAFASDNVAEASITSCFADRTVLFLHERLYGVATAVTFYHEGIVRTDDTNLTPALVEDLISRIVLGAYAKPLTCAEINNEHQCVQKFIPGKVFTPKDHMPTCPCGQTEVENQEDIELTVALCTTSEQRMSFDAFNDGCTIESATLDGDSFDEDTLWEFAAEGGSVLSLFTQRPVPRLDDLGVFDMDQEIDWTSDYLAAPPPPMITAPFTALTA